MRESYASTKDRDLAWLMWLTIVIVTLLLVWLPAVVVGGAWNWALMIGRVAVLYFVGWYGLRQALVFLPSAIAGIGLASAPALLSPMRQVRTRPEKTRQGRTNTHARA